METERINQATRRKALSPDQVMSSGSTAAERIAWIESQLQAERNHRPIDGADESVRAKNVELLREALTAQQNEQRLREERLSGIDRERERLNAAEAEQRKVEALKRIRRGFLGTDQDWERLKDQLYDRYLLEERDDALATALASGKYLA